MLARLTVLGLIPAALSSTLPLVEPRDPSLSYHGVCTAIKKVISHASAVFYPGSNQYLSDIYHFTPSSSQDAVCSVEPGTPQDVAAILKVLEKKKAPFAIKSGGHTQNQGFSSTKGVQITLNRFNQTVYHSGTTLVDLGPGQTWDEVYAKLEPYGVNVLGGRNFGVGVGGFLLGGGYSWNTNEHGLSIDSIVSYELVTPTAKIITVNATSHPDLFFGLKGGLNNFGVVTKYTMKSYSQGPVWGGRITFSEDHFDKYTQAITNFAFNNTDRRAQVTAQYSSGNNTQIGTLFLFYNAANVTGSVFDEFLSIPYQTKDLATRSFYSLVVSVTANLQNTGSLRGGLATVALPALTLPVVSQLYNQTKYWGSIAPFAKGAFLTTGLEPFIPSSIVSNASTAFPHDRFMSPPALLWFWPDAKSDEAGQKALAKACEAVRATALETGSDLAGLSQYPNYAAPNTPLVDVYGKNVPRLRNIAAKYDPKRLMHQAGSFRF